MKLERASGILVHISSLPGPNGIGDIGKEAYKFVDFLCECNQKIWQVSRQHNCYFLVQILICLLSLDSSFDG